MLLKDTIPLMNSEDYHERFKAEYYQAVIRYNRILKMLIDWEAGTLEFTPNCDEMVYRFQMKAMAEYIAVLKMRAQIEGINLEVKDIFNK